MSRRGIQDLSPGVRWLVVIALVAVFVIVGMIVKPVPSHAASTTSCVPKAPYTMWDNGDNRFVSHPGIGRMWYHRVGAGFDAVYTTFWAVNPGYVICKATVTYNGQQAGKVVVTPGHPFNGPTTATTTTRQGSWGYRSGKIPGHAWITVYVRKKIGA